MTAPTAELTKKLRKEIALTPPKYRPLLLKLVHSFRETMAEDASTELSPADSLRQALREVKAGKARSIEGLWDRVGL